jgi:hypothetical protein
MKYTGVDRVFSVTLSSTSTQTTSVIYGSANGTTAVPSDYVATSGSLIFNPGDTTRTIAVSVNGDAVFEGNENFLVKLTTAANAVNDRG